MPILDIGSGSAFIRVYPLLIGGRLSLLLFANCNCCSSVPFDVKALAVASSVSPRLRGGF